jgi:DNA-binding response OmpR family regulator
MAGIGNKTLLMSEHMQTLVVDDEEGIRFVLAETMQRDGHVVATAESGEEALEYLRETPFDLVLLDLMLGGRIDGLDVLKAIRWRWPEAVVIILTAHGSLESAMEAIRGGVDRYLLKPVRPDDLRSAVEEALDQQRRRVKQVQEDQKTDRILQYGPFTADLQKHIMTLYGKVIDLTPREFKLLVHLMQNSHRVISPTELVQVVRQYNCQDIYEARQIIKWYIHRLRHKIEPDPAHSRYILSIRGVGYRFKE